MSIEVNNTTINDEIDEQRISSPSLLLPYAKDPAETTTTTTTHPRLNRRSIFHSYWQKKTASTSSCNSSPCSSALIASNDCTDPLQHEVELGGRRKRPSKLEPSYLGVYSFVPLKPKPCHRSPPPGLTPIGGSTDSITPSSSSPPSPPCLKSILRRCHGHGCPPCQQSGTTTDNCNNNIGQSLPVPSNTNVSSRQFHIRPLPFDDVATVEDCNVIISKTKNIVEMDVKRRHTPTVHFDPTITVHECVVDIDQCCSSSSCGDSGTWFTENELRSFLHETMNLCRSSAINAHKSYCLPEVKKSCDAAHEVGIKCPVLSSTYSTHRALFAEEVLHTTDDDAIVHDGSLEFFQLMKEEMQRILIVDNSLSSRKLFRRHILSMFPHSHVDLATSGEDVLDKIDVCYERGCINYDLVVVEEHLHRGDEVATTCSSSSLDLTGSELLCLLNEMEVGTTVRPEMRDKSKKFDSRKSLKIGVSVSLGRDCESLRIRGGADLFWSKPPPKPSNLLRNQVLNALLSKRGSAVFVCGC